MSLCLPSVSLTRPLSPLLSPCSCLQLLLGLVSSSAPLLKALELYCSEKNAKKEFVRRLRGSVSQNLISDLVRTSFGTSLKLQPVKTQPREVLERLCNSLLLGLLLLLLLLLVHAASGHGAVFGQRAKRFVKGLEAVRKKPKA